MSWINKYAQSSFSVKILMSLVIFLIFLIISSIMIVVITALCENHMSYVELLRLNLSVQSLGLFVIPPFFVALLFSNHPFKLCPIIYECFGGCCLYGSSYTFYELYHRLE